MGHDDPISPDEARDLATMQVVMGDKSPVTITIDMTGAWLLLSALQLAVRHPQLSPSMVDYITQIGRQIQTHITAVHPATKPVLEAGWHAQYDR